MVKAAAPVTGGSSGFHCTGEGGGIAHPLYERNGERARAVHAGRSRAGNGAEQGGSENGRRGGSAPGTAGELARSIFLSRESIFFLHRACRPCMVPRSDEHALFAEPG